MFREMKQPRLLTKRGYFALLRKPRPPYQVLLRMLALARTPKQTTTRLGGGTKFVARMPA